MDVRHKKNTTFACIVVLLFGLALFHQGTDGFRAFTAEAARVNELNAEHPKFPNVTMEDSAGRTFSLSELAGKYVFITFIYTSCGTVCPQLETNMAKVYEKLPPPSIGKDVVFLTISFDPARDDVAALNKYRDYFKIDGETWRIARIPDSSELEKLLKAFGVTVIPDGRGNFMHNAAFYLVDRQGRLAQVMDYTKIDAAADKIRATIESDGGKRP